MNAVRHRLQKLRKLRSSFSARLSEPSHHELAGSINSHKEIQLSFGGPNFGDVHVEIADPVLFELLPFRLVTLHVGQPAGAMPLRSGAAKSASAGECWAAGHRGNRREAAENTA